MATADQGCVSGGLRGSLEAGPAPGGRGGAAIQLPVPSWAVPRKAGLPAGCRYQPELSLGQLAAPPRQP